MKRNIFRVVLMILCALLCAACVSCKGDGRPEGSSTPPAESSAPVESSTPEESEEPEVADKYDYYYVPTFYLDGEKAHEGGIYPDEVTELLRKALE